MTQRNGTHDASIKDDETGTEPDNDEAVASVVEDGTLGRMDDAGRHIKMKDDAVRKDGRKSRQGKKVWWADRTGG